MIVDASDVDDIVVDKREGWRASPAKARRRQRRYARLLTARLILDGDDAEAAGDDLADGALTGPEGPRDHG
jgi:hypothetical protein